MATEQNGLRERKKTALQRLLTDTTIDLFLEHGFHGTTVDRIAEVAGISRRTFFHYFPAKQDVVTGMVCANKASILQQLSIAGHGMNLHGTR